MLTEVEIVARVVRTAFAALVLLLAVRFILRPTLVEVFRQRMFGLRRELFLMRADGVVPDDESYRLLFRMINASLRFAEGITFSRLLFTGLFAFERDRAPDPIEVAISKVDPEKRKILEDVRERAGFEIVRHMMLTSPVAWILTVVALPIVIVLVMIGATRRWIRTTMFVVGMRPAVRRLESDTSALFGDDVVRA